MQGNKFSGAPPGRGPESGGRGGRRF